MQVKIKKLSENAIMPTKATPGSAGYDVYAPRDFEVKIGRSILPLEFAIELPYGYEAKIEARSGFSSKGFAGVPWIGIETEYRYDADVIPGKVDCDYRDEVGVIIKSNAHFFVKKGTRIAQMTIYKAEGATFSEASELTQTERHGGFGHTGIK